MDLDYVYPVKKAVPGPAVSLLSDSQIAASYVNHRESGDNPTLAKLQVVSEATGVQVVPPDSVAKVCSQVDDEVAIMRKISANADDFKDEAEFRAALDAVKQYLNVDTWIAKLYVYYGVADFDALKLKLEAVKVAVAQK